MVILKHALSICLLIVVLSHSREWSFAVISDPREDKATFTNALQEIRDMSEPFCVKPVKLAIPP